jgi:hypothetical protein
VKHTLSAITAKARDLFREHDSPRQRSQRPGVRGDLGAATVSIDFIDST